MVQPVVHHNASKFGNRYADVSCASILEFKNCHIEYFLFSMCSKKYHSTQHVKPRDEEYESDNTQSSSGSIPPAGASPKQTVQVIVLGSPVCL